jgi:hypothetical protein
MRLTYRARAPRSAGPTIVGRDGIERPVGAIAPDPIDVPADWRTPGWRPRAEAHLIALEGPHRAAQEAAAGMRERLVILAARIEKGRGMIADYLPMGMEGPPPAWREALDALEVEHAALAADLAAAVAERDRLADDYCRKLKGYERLICLEDGLEWAPW